MVSISEDAKALAEAIADAVEAKLASRPRYLCELQPDRYIADHEWVMAARAKADASAKFWNDLSLSLAKAGLVGLLAFLFILTANGLRQWLQQFLK